MRRVAAETRPFVRLTRVGEVDRPQVFREFIPPDPDWTPPPDDMGVLMVGVAMDGPRPSEMTMAACAAQFARAVKPPPLPGGLRPWLVHRRGPMPDRPSIRHMGLRRPQEELAERTGFPASAWHATVPSVRRGGLVLAGAAPVAAEHYAAAVAALQDPGVTPVLLFTAVDLGDGRAVLTLLDDATPATERLAADRGLGWRHLPLTRVARGDVVALPFGDVDAVERRVDCLGDPEILRALLTPAGLASA